jgi:hypothetical protein
MSINGYGICIESNGENILSIQNNSSTATNNNLFVESSNNNYILELKASSIIDINNITIEKYNDYELILTNTVYANLPDEIPMSIISGNLNVSRIEGLDDYLTTIPIDGGTP